MHFSSRLTNNHSHLIIYSLWLFLPLIPLITPWSISLGLSASHAVLLPLVVGFVFPPILQLIFPASLPVLNPQAKLSRPWRLYLDLLVVASVPLQALMLITSVNFFTSTDLNLFSSVIFLAGVGSFSGFCAINVGHEFIHAHSIPGVFPRSRAGFLTLHPAQGAMLSKLFATFLLSSVWFGSFISSHLRIHHLNIGTPRDPYTAKRGETVFQFVSKNIVFGIKNSLSYEYQSINLKGKTLFSSEVSWSVLLSTLFSLLFYLFWGTKGVVFFLGQAFFAILLLEWINYLQHYGIIRSTDSISGLEPVRDWHSWDEYDWLSGIYFINLFRHADHHMNPNKPYYMLTESADSLTYPFPYIIMMAISLCPPVFFSITHRILDSHPMLAMASNRT